MKNVTHGKKNKLAPRAKQATRLKPPSKAPLSDGGQLFIESSKAALKEHGLKLTLGRQSVIALLAETRLPATPLQIAETLNQKRRVIDTVSVYRTLEVLEVLHLIHRVFPSGGYRPCFHQECGEEYHLLLQCSQCAEVSEIGVPLEFISSLTQHVQKKHKFAVDPHPMQVNGLCHDCK